MMKAYVFIRLNSFYREDMKRAIEQIRIINGIETADGVFGNIDIIAIAKFQTFEEIKRILEEIYATGMVRDTDTRIVYPL
ncbi:MAG: Lrp/AsnC ligand binding domain-containing protein [candidate division WOR-3 bacterium]